MTCVIGYIDKKSRKIYMGSDSIGTDDHNGRMVRRDPKIFQKYNMLIGFAGSYRIGQLLNSSLFQPPKYEDEEFIDYFVSKFIPVLYHLLDENKLIHQKDGEEPEMAAQLLIGFHGALIKIETDFQVEIHLDDFDAIGSGGNEALASLITYKKLSGKNKIKPDILIATIIESVAQINWAVGGPVQISTI